MPIFFALAGLNADLSILNDPSLIGLTAGLIAIASIGKFGGAFLGGAFGRLTRRESLCCGSQMIIIETFRRGQQPQNRPTPGPSKITIDTS
jgi:Kef-type K+ transport system membrane component KefB